MDRPTFFFVSNSSLIIGSQSPAPLSCFLFGQVSQLQLQVLGFCVLPRSTSSCLTWAFGPSKFECRQMPSIKTPRSPGALGAVKFRSKLNSLVSHKKTVGGELFVCLKTSYLCLLGEGALLPRLSWAIIYIEQSLKTKAVSD